MTPQTETKPDTRLWFVMPPTAKGAKPDIYAVEPNEEYELLQTVETMREAKFIVENHNQSIKFL